VRVQTRDLRKHYRGTQALDGVHLDLPAGRVVGILGENGSGKSTLFRILAGVTRPSAGQVLLDGIPPGPATQARTAYLPEIDPFYEWMTVGEQLTFLAAFYPGWAPAKATELVEFMGLDEGARIGTLSQGQRARLKIVAAFAWPSDLVVMDEPFNGIDPPSRRRILAALLQEYRAAEQTILVSTHLVDEVEELVEEVVYLRAGQVAVAGSADGLRADRGGSLSDIFEEVVA
jgi:ABC-2 type transport system ATP-binding protein